MLSEWELWACANEYLRQRGDDAPIHAAMRADELLEAGDVAGAANWRAIIHRLNELLAQPSAMPNWSKFDSYWLRSTISLASPTAQNWHELRLLRQNESFLR